MSQATSAKLLNTEVTEKPTKICYILVFETEYKP